MYVTVKEIKIFRALIRKAIFKGSWSNCAFEDKSKTAQSGILFLFYLIFASCFHRYFLHVCMCVCKKAPRMYVPGRENFLQNLGSKQGFSWKCGELPQKLWQWF